MATNPRSPYRTIYNLKTGEPRLIYASSLPGWLATGEYATEPVDPAQKIAPELLAPKLPTAGREATRKPLEEEYRNEILGAELAVKALQNANTQDEVTTGGGVQADGDNAAPAAPARPAPRRRPAASDPVIEA